MRKPILKRLSVEQLGPIRSADVEFGDLSILVGPQATGKSIFLQTLKLLIDRDQIHDMFARHNLSFDDRGGAFFDAYYGRGIANGWETTCRIMLNGKPVDVGALTRTTKSRTRHERLFYIPAQRVMSLPGGVSQNFGTFNFGDPYALRAFSDAIHDLIQNEFAAKGELFPSSSRLNATLAKPVSEHLFGGARLVMDESDFIKRLALQVPGNPQPLSFLSWSAGQREFTPMLMGLYWLCSLASTRRAESVCAHAVEWVVIEEPEMGLHPKGIEVVLLLVLDLLRRGYRVVLSTHSPVVLELVWALQEFKKLNASESSVRRVFGLPSVPVAKELASTALAKDLRVYFFDRQGSVSDISALDPGAEHRAEAEWGGLVGFSSLVHTEIARAVNAADMKGRGLGGTAVQPSNVRRQSTSVG